MSKIWESEQEVSCAVARRLIEEQFPELAPVELYQLGNGWDNTVFKVNYQYVFRFPRRQIAVELLSAEARILPVLTGRLPLPVPEPLFFGEPDGQYPWPFLGYRLIPGRMAVEARLSSVQRLAAAPVLARFLKALHGIPTEEVGGLIPPDIIGRLDVKKRIPRLLDYLKRLVHLGIIDSISPYVWIAEAAEETGPGLQEQSVVHGDLHAGNILVDESGNVTGVIDWGDVHCGSPAVDLSVVYSFLPPAGRKQFWQAYGQVDRATHILARFKALYTSAYLTAYAHDIGHTDYLLEGRRALNLVIRD